MKISLLFLNAKEPVHLGQKIRYGHHEQRKEDLLAVPADRRIKLKATEKKSRTSFGNLLALDTKGQGCKEKGPLNLGYKPGVHIRNKEDMLAIPTVHRIKMKVTEKNRKSLGSLVSLDNQ